MRQCCLSRYEYMLLFVHFVHRTFCFACKCLLHLYIIQSQLFIHLHNFKYKIPRIRPSPHPSPLLKEIISKKKSSMSRRGISAREAGAKGSTNELHNWSTYELRQELKKRGHFLDDYDGSITYEILLKKLTTLLHEEHTADEKQRLAKIDLELHTKYKDSSNNDNNRFRRKQEAIARSKMRQLDDDYFRAKKLANEQGAQKDKQRCDDSLKNSSEDNSYEPMDILKESDPFKTKFRSRIGGRCI